jgi:hypothetical protein
MVGDSYKFLTVAVPGKVVPIATLHDKYLPFSRCLAIYCDFIVVYFLFYRMRAFLVPQRSEYVIIL